MYNQNNKVEMERSMSELSKVFVVVAATMIVLFPIAIIVSYRDAVTSIPLGQTVKASSLKRTVVTAQLKVPIESRTNIIWCAVSQMAWNELVDLAGGELNLDPPTAIAESLNRGLVSRDDIDEASYVTQAGIIGKGIKERICAEYEAKFGEPAHRYISAMDLLPSGSYATFAHLRKDLVFKVKFDEYESGIRFGWKKVKAFGINESSELALSKYVMELAAESERDFVLEIKTTSPDDRLILAKVPSEDNLYSTIIAVNRRIANGKPHEANSESLLAIPNFDFDIEAEFKALIGKTLVCGNPEVNGQEMAYCRQHIEFALTGSGVKLRATSTMLPNLGIGSDDKSKPINYIFDRPFLLMLKRARREMPYFAMWVDNAEMLIPE